MYYKIYQAYNNIFKKIGVTAIPMLADTGEIGGDLSHEFHVLSKTGETEIFYDENILSINFNDLSFEEIKKIAAFTEEKKENRNLSDYKSARGIEVGQIFYIGKKYTQALDFKVQDKDMQLVHPEMATFGIGVGRLMAAVIEASHDEDGIIWPESIAPFDFVLINANSKNQELKDASELIYSSMIASGKEVLYDDTDKTFGEKMKNADLIGIPNKIIVGKNWLEGNLIEVKNRKTKGCTLLTLEQLMQF
jgi:prolyl-tRNA synthetase